MVNKTVVSDRSRSEIRELLRKVSTEKGGIALAMLAQSPDLGDKWSFVISAPWIDLEEPRAVVGYLSAHLKRYLDRDALSTIDRISTLRSDHRLVITILDFLGLEISLDSDAYPIRDFVIEDVRFPMAFVFIAERHPENKRIAGYSANRHAAIRQ